MRNLLMIALGGAGGALLRYGIGLGIKHWTAGSHWATLTVNLVGSFVLGFLWAAYSARLPREAQNLLFVGLLGAFTTFSTFELDLHRLWTGGHVRTALVYLLVSVLGGVGMLSLGAVAGHVGHERRLQAQAGRPLE